MKAFSSIQFLRTSLTVYRRVFGEVEALPESIIERQYRTGSSIHESFRDMALLRQINSVPLLKSAGPVTALPQKGRHPNRQQRTARAFGANIVESFLGDIVQQGLCHMD